MEIVSPNKETPRHSGFWMQHVGYELYLVGTENRIKMTGWFLGMSWTTKCCAADQHPIVNFQERSRRLMRLGFTCVSWTSINGKLCSQVCFLTWGMA